MKFTSILFILSLICVIYKSVIGIAAIVPDDHRRDSGRAYIQNLMPGQPLKLECTARGFRTAGGIKPTLLTFGARTYVYAGPQWFWNDYLCTVACAKAPKGFTFLAYKPSKYREDCADYGCVWLVRPSGIYLRSFRPYRSGGVIYRWPVAGGRRGKLNLHSSKIKANV